MRLGIAILLLLACFSADISAAAKNNCYACTAHHPGGWYATWGAYGRQNCLNGALKQCQKFARQKKENPRSCRPGEAYLSGGCDLPNDPPKRDPNWCNYDSECGWQRVCVGGYCIPKDQIGDQRCSEDSQCGENRKCNHMGWCE